MTETAVTIAELRTWASAVFDAVEARGVDTVDLQGRHYWTLDTKEIWGPEAPQPSLGDLADDLQDIRNDLGETYGSDDRANFAWHTLDHFCGVLAKLSADLKGHGFNHAEAKP